MNPDFMLNTHLNVEQYRKGLWTTYRWTNIVVPTICGIILLYMFFGYTLPRIIDNNYFDWLSILLEAAGVTSMVFSFFLPKKQIEAAVANFIMSTGNPIVENDVYFYADRIFFRTVNTHADVYVPYGFVDRLYFFDDFIMIHVQNKTAIYIPLSDVNDVNAFVNYINAKCPNAKTINKVNK